jgi:sugar lactone lactonase YvrE
VSFASSIAPVSEDPNAAGWHIVRRQLTDAELAAPIDFRISLKMRDLAGLQARIQAGQQVSQAEMEARYLPAKSDYDNLVAWVKSQGIPITLVDRNHTTVYLKASVAEISTIFGSRFARVGRNGAEYTSAITAPSLPMSLIGNVLSINGLQTHRNLRRKPIGHLGPQLFEGGTNPPYVTPLDIADAYDFPTTLTGAGQTIAFYEDSPPESNLEFYDFWHLLGINQSINRVTLINPNNIAVNSDEPETTADVEWAGGLAPGAAMRVYIYSDPLAGVGAVLNDVPKTPGLSVLSISFGGDESDSYDPSFSQTFTQLAAAGVSVVASAGDYQPGVDAPGVEYPASDPNVTGVGGTSLEFNSSGAVLGEWGFQYSGILSTGSLGTIENQPGASSVFPIPTWQASTIGTYNADNPSSPLGDGLHRVVPDVSAFAIGDGEATYALDYDDNEAVFSYDGVYGTSLSAPIWAGTVALINQERAQLGMSSIGLLNPSLYQTFYLNQLNLPPPLAILGVTGTYSYQYESGTGLGRPDVNELILCLANSFYAYADQWSTAMVPGGSITLSAESSSSGSSFQWQEKTGSGWTNISDGTNASLFISISGSSSKTLTLTALTGFPGGYQFRALATSSLGVTAPTGPISVALGKPLGTLINATPTSPVGIGSTVTLSVVGSTQNGSQYNATYQWELNGVPIKGAQYSAVNITVTPASEGTYSVVITDPSNPAQDFTVNAGFLEVALPSTVYHVSLLAGGAVGFQDGTGASARFNGGGGLAVDSSGNVYVADSYNNAIRKITPAGVTTTVAGQSQYGNADGTGTAAKFYGPEGVAVDSTGNIFVADTINNEIRMITPGGVVSTLAGGVSGYSDGQGANAKFYYPTGVAVQGSGPIYVADRLNSEIRSVTRSGLVSTVAPFSYANGIAEDQGGDLFVVSPFASNGFGELPSGASQVSTLTAFANSSYDFSSICVDQQGNVYVAIQSGISEVTQNGTLSLIYTDTGSTIGSGNNTEIGASTSDTSGNLYYTFSGGDNPEQFAIYVAKPFATITTPAPTNTASPGIPVQMAVTTSNIDGTPSYQWKFNGVNIPGATQATLTIQDPGPADRGFYSVVITDSAGTSTLNAGTLNVGSSDSWLANLSARAYVESGSNVLISGFEIASGTGSTNKNVLVTGKGPVLAPAGISNYLPNPVVDLYDSQSKLIATDTGWSNAPVSATGSGASSLSSQLSVNPVSAKLITNASGSAPATGSADSMLVSALPAGGYTSVISDANGKDGVAIAEVYDVDSLLGNSGNTARLSNLSARSFVGTGNEVLIAGFVIDGGPSGEPETVMIRGQGPNLASYVQGALTQTKITLYQNLSTGSYPIASNSGWGTTPTYASGSGISSLATTGVGLESAPTALQLQYAGNALQTGSSDSAMVVTLPPGAYTVILDPAGGLPGVGLVEVFELR